MNSDNCSGEFLLPRQAARKPSSQAGPADWAGFSYPGDNHIF